MPKHRATSKRKPWYQSKLCPWQWLVRNETAIQPSCCFSGHPSLRASHLFPFLSWVPCHALYYYSLFSWVECIRFRRRRLRDECISVFYLRRYSAGSRFHCYSLRAFFRSPRGFLFSALWSKLFRSSRTRMPVFSVNFRFILCTAPPMKSAGFPNHGFWCPRCRFRCT